MNISRHKKFDKQFSKLGKKDKKKILEHLGIFIENPFNPILRNHTLQGKFKGWRSIDVGFDLRLIYKSDENHTEVKLLSVGTHSQLYG